MTNFELKIIPAGEKKMVLLAESAFGEVVTQINEAFFVKMVEKSEELRMIYDLSIRRGRSFQKEVEDATGEFGEELFKGVFHDEILNLFNRTIGGSVNGQVNLRLMLGEPGLNSIQWEVMRFRNEYVGFKHNLVRHPFAPYPVRGLSGSDRRLRILIVSVDPFFRGTVDQEHHDTMNMLKGFGDDIELIELFQSEATLENIKEILFGGVDIWHFNGHGAFDINNHLDSALIVWGEEGAEYGRLSVRLLSTLAINQSLGFCFLSACDTGRSVENNKKEKIWEKSDNFVNMAYSLIEVGVPVVLATNHVITVEATKLFSKRFYSSVLKYGKLIDQAVRDARSELYIAANEGLSFSEWSCPALYARSRYMGLGTEHLHWRQAFDIYAMRNVNRPTLHVTE